jgi:hypothetical protein
MGSRFRTAKCGTRPGPIANSEIRTAQHGTRPGRQPRAHASIHGLTRCRYRRSLFAGNSAVLVPCEAATRAVILAVDTVTQSSYHFL